MTASGQLAQLSPLGVIGAMTEEVQRLRRALSTPESLPAGPFTVHRGELDGVEVLLAECGVGKVNAAALTQLLIDRGVRAILFTGVAGAVDHRLRVGDVVIGSDAVQHDVDVSGLGYELGEVPGVGRTFPADERLVALARAAAEDLDGVGVYSGRIASGDTFVSDPDTAASIAETFSALCTEMEGAACAQVCHRWQLPFVIVRSISDGADASAQSDFRAFTKVAAANAESIVRGVVRRLVARQ